MLKRGELLWSIVLAALALVAAEWMRTPVLAFTAGIVMLAALVAWSARGQSALVFGAAVALAMALVAVWSWAHQARLERSWPSEREALISMSSRRLASGLDQSVRRVRALAAAGALRLAEPRDAAFDDLPRLLRDAPTEAVVLFDSAGRPAAWAGPARAPLDANGPELSAVTTPFYLWLVARRHTDQGTAVAALLLARDSAAPAGVPLTDRFQQHTGVALRFLAPRLAPADTDVFDYVLPEGLGKGDTLFAVQPVPPTQAVALGDAQRGGRMLMCALAALLLLAAAGGGARRVGPAAATLITAVAALGFLARAPLQETFGPTSVFGPATFYRRQLGPFSASAGALLVTGLVAVLVVSALWRRGLAPKWATRAIAAIAVLLAPYILQTLARGITPPASGVSLPLWLTWQGAIVLAASAVVLLAAALVRGREAPAHSGPWPWIAAALAAGAAVAGLWLWEPVGAWPEWYPYLWLPSLVIAMKPMPFRGTLATVAVVAGSAAALLTWGATTEGRMALARRDLESLGDRADAVEVAMLDHMIAEAPVDSLPSSAAELYRLWRTSALGAQGYPASLAAWSASGDRLLALDLAETDVAPELVQQVAAEASRMGLPLVRPLVQVPGLFAIAAIPVTPTPGAPGGGVVTIVVGPRTRLVPPSRVAEFLSGAGGDVEPPYEALLSPPEAASAVLPTGVSWTREGWLVRGDRAIDLPGGARHAHALIDLRGPWPLLQRGVLVLAVDVAALLLLWGLLELLDGRHLAAYRVALPRAVRSLRARLAVSLAGFFLIPTLAFAAWSYARLGDEFRGARELLLQRTLRDAAAALDPTSGPGELFGVSRRVEADLFLSDSGRTLAASAPILLDLGLVDELVPGRAYRQLAYGDELLTTERQQGTGAPILIGYRLMARSATGEAAVLAAPELLTDVTLRRREADLGIAVLVGVLMGLIAALVLAGIAARELALPLQQLRRAALSLGGADPSEVRPGPLPAELEPVGAAIEQAARDVERSQRAQRVLAWGEMARQVAHEIKNPLTPIRLGIQHLLRLRRDRPAELSDALEEAGGRILREIDRLDDIARTFSRFAAPPEAAGQGPLGAVDVSQAAHDVVELYRVGSGGVTWLLEAPAGVTARARRDELVQVLVNLCENARDAGARHVTVRVVTVAGGGCSVDVSDDGRGIPGDVLPRLFEPQFRTTTSGSGLGLAITKRLVESWGGIITAESGPAGTRMLIRLEEAGG